MTLMATTSEIYRRSTKRFECRMLWVTVAREEAMMIMAVKMQSRPIERVPACSVAAMLTVKGHIVLEEAAGVERAGPSAHAAAAAALAAGDGDDLLV
mmetsp:Transcript_33520/g.65280  ORF Transcript_33520/g.65280 Transcript_33520/m.65280 type:complete len:97 (+) Transcript_33520:1844-2134(+)